MRCFPSAPSSSALQSGLFESSMLPLAPNDRHTPPPTTPARGGGGCVLARLTEVGGWGDVSSLLASPCHLSLLVSATAACAAAERTHSSSWRRGESRTLKKKCDDGTEEEEEAEEPVCRPVDDVDDDIETLLFDSPPADNSTQLGDHDHRHSGGEDDSVESGKSRKKPVAVLWVSGYVPLFAPRIAQTLSRHIGVSRAASSKGQPPRSPSSAVTLQCCFSRIIILSPMHSDAHAEVSMCAQCRALHCIIYERRVVCTVWYITLYMREVGMCAQCGTLDYI